MSIAIIGNGGLGREVKSYFDKVGIESSFFVSDEFYNGEHNTSKLSELDIERYHVLVCIADCGGKEKIVKSLPKQTKYFTFIHPSAQVYTEHEIGEGSIICSNVVITSNVRIGNHVLVNLNSTIGHDTIIGDYCTINPNSSISGNCKIKSNVFIGSGSSIREKIEIESEAIIGLGTVVVKDIIEEGTYVGVPSRKIK